MSVTVWVLVMTIITGSAPPVIVIDNIATREACLGLREQLGRDSGAKGRAQCYPVKKIVR